MCQPPTGRLLRLLGGLLVAALLPTRAQVIEDLKGVHLTIVTVEDPPFITVRKDFDQSHECHPANGGKDCPVTAIDSSEEWVGWIMEIVNALSESSGFTYSLQLPSQGNSYGSADADLRLTRPTSVYLENMKAGRGGNVSLGPSPPHPDFIAGAGGARPNVYFAGAYVTPKRVADFVPVSSYYTAPLSLLIRKPDKSWRHQAFQWLRPFTMWLWVLLGITTVAAGILFLYLEGYTIVPSVDHEYYSFLRDEERFRLPQYVKSLTISVYYSFATMSGINTWSPNTVKGKILAVTWTIFMLLVIVSYTAKLAVWLAYQPLILAPESFEHLLTKHESYSSCVLKGSAYANYLSSNNRYEDITQVTTYHDGKNVSGLGPMAEALAFGVCDSVIERKMHLDYIARSGEYEKAGGSGGRNSYFIVLDELRDGPQQLAPFIRGGHIFNVNPAATAGTPNEGLTSLTSEEVSKRLSKWVAKFVADGTITKLHEYAVLRGTDYTESSLEEESVQLGTIDLAGALLIYVTGTLFILAWRLYSALDFHLYKVTIKELFNAKVMLDDRVKLPDYKRRRFLSNEKLLKRSKDMLPALRSLKGGPTHDKWVKADPSVMKSREDQLIYSSVVYELLCKWKEHHRWPLVSANRDENEQVKITLEVVRTVAGSGRFGKNDGNFNLDQLITDEARESFARAMTRDGDIIFYDPLADYLGTTMAIDGDYDGDPLAISDASPDTPDLDAMDAPGKAADNQSDGAPPTPKHMKRSASRRSSLIQQRSFVKVYSAARPAESPDSELGDDKGFVTYSIERDTLRRAQLAAAIFVEWCNSRAVRDQLFEPTRRQLKQDARQLSHYMHSSIDMHPYVWWESHHHELTGHEDSHGKKVNLAKDKYPLTKAASKWDSESHRVSILRTMLEDSATESLQSLINARYNAKRSGMDMAANATLSLSQSDEADLAAAAKGDPVTLAQLEGQLADTDSIVEPEAAARHINING